MDTDDIDSYFDQERDTREPDVDDGSFADDYAELESADEATRGEHRAAIDEVCSADECWCHDETGGEG